jgi:hypothetical protein
LEYGFAVLLLCICAAYGHHRHWDGAIGTALATRIWPFHLENWPWRNGVEWSGRVYVTLTAAVAALAATIFWLRTQRRALALLLLLVCAYGFHFALNMQRNGYPDSLHRTFERQIEYWHDVRWVGSHFLASYPDQEKLSLHGKTHPPAYALFLYLVRRLGARSMDAAAVVCSLFTTVTALLLYGFARRRFDERMATFALPLFLFACSVSAFTISLMDMMNMACAALSLYGLALILDGKRAGAPALGIGYALATLCTLTSAVLGLAYVVILWASLPRSNRRLSALPWRALGVAVAAFAGVYAVLMAFGYRPVHTIAALMGTFAVSANAQRNYFRGFSGSPISWTGALGMPLMGLAAHVLATLLRPVGRRVGIPPAPAAENGERDPVRVMLLAATAPFLLCVLLGAPRAEVEHIFMFLVPPLVLGLAAAAARWFRRSSGWVIAACALAMAQSIVIEIYLDTSW